MYLILIFLSINYFSILKETVGFLLNLPLYLALLGGSLQGKGS